MQYLTVTVQMLMVDLTTPAMSSDGQIKDKTRNVIVKQQYKMCYCKILAVMQYLSQV